jgi:hypothetical protein
LEVGINPELRNEAPRKNQASQARVEKESAEWETGTAHFVSVWMGGSKVETKVRDSGGDGKGRGVSCIWYTCTVVVVVAKYLTRHAEAGKITGQTGGANGRRRQDDFIEACTGKT